jgi:hypothetical protein
MPAIRLSFDLIDQGMQRFTSGKSQTSEGAGITIPDYSDKTDEVSVPTAGKGPEAAFVDYSTTPSALPRTRSD